MKIFSLSRSVFVMLFVFLQACAVPPSPEVETVAPVSIEAQKIAQQSAMKAAAEKNLNLKRKIAIGRVSNETIFGRSLLRDDQDDPLGKQVSDMLAQKLIESGQFLIIERPDISRVKSESELTNTDINIVGVDSLILGSLTEFGRTTTGSKGFLSKSKKQTASAKVALRLVDAKNGLAYFSAAGAGQASLESGETAFVGSTASYDGTLNDKAIDNAVSDVVDDIISNLTNRPWSTSILNYDANGLYISGGKSQGIRPGMVFSVETAGKQIKSPQTGFIITLPGKNIASIKIISNFGDSEINEGSLATIVSGSIGNNKIKELKITESN
jgi:curli biogenesis system outer membrane secretion channel CsgG